MASGGGAGVGGGVDDLLRVLQRGAVASVVGGSNASGGVREEIEVTQGMPCVLGGMAQVSDGGNKEAPDRLTDPEPNAIGVPSAELSLGWMLASRANLRFTRREVDTASVSAMQDQPRVAGQEGWQKCS
jgi:hypothetical protein